MKKLIRIFRNILIVLVVIIVSLFGLSKIFEDEIIAKAIQMINTKVSVPISVDEVELNLYRSFPQLTVDLQGVRIASSDVFSKNNFDELENVQLLDLKNIYLSFNLISILNDSFDIEKIQLSGGAINILVNKKGINNYQIFRESETEKTDANLDLNISSIQLKGVKVNYINAYKHLGVYLQSNNFIAKGRILNDDFTVTTKGEVKLNKYTSHSFNFVPKNPTNLQADLVLNKNELKVNSASIITKGIQFNSIGSILLTDPVKVDVSIAGDEISIESLLDVLPKNIDFLKNVDAKGMLEINSRILGQVSGKISPRMKTIFKIRNGELNQKNTNINIRQLMLNGEFNNYSTPNLSVQEFSFRSDSSSFDGSLKLHSLKNPVLSLETSFNIFANEMYALFLKEKVDSLSGTIKGNLVAKGKLPENFSFESLTEIEHKGNVNVNNFNLLMQEQNIDVKSTSGNLQLENNQLVLNNIEGRIQNTDIECKGAISNFSGIFSKNKVPVNIEGSLKAKELNYKDIEPWFASGNDSSSNSSPLNINADLNIQHFQYDNFKGSNITGDLTFGKNKLTVNPLKFNAFDGKIDTYLSLDMKDENLNVLQTLTNTYSVDISKLFAGLNNFNQTFITDKNISGKVTSSFESEISIVNGDFVAKSLDFLGHIKITEGKLLDFEPAQKLSAFSDIDDLRKLSFSNLENDILINDGKITIPKMEIESNIADISIFGEQELNGNYSYHIKLLLSDLLHSKSKRLKERQSKFGTIEDDGLGRTSIYLLATGANGKTDVKFDRKELKANLSSNMKEERKEVKQILKEEFGWFKKDTTLKKDTPKSQFQIEWDDE